MLRLVRSQLRHAGWRAVALGSAILVAALSFVSLSSAAKTADLRVRGSVESAFRPAYDILVRPADSFGQLESRERLVRSNYLSGLSGGITRKQYEEIKRIPRIDVAAPIANLGYVMAQAWVPVSLERFLNEKPVQLLRVRQSFVAHNGTSRYRGPESYVYYTRRNPFVHDGILEILPDGRTLPVCDGFRLNIPYEATRLENPSLFCYSQVSPGQGHDSSANIPPGTIRAGARLMFPVSVAAIDPVQEARLLRLDQTIVEGRYLRQHEPAARKVFRRGEYGATFAPVIASVRSYVDERLEQQVEQLAVPRPAAVPHVLAASEAYRFLTRAPGRSVGRLSFGPSGLYPRFLRSGRLSSSNYWISAGVRYERRRDGALMPMTVRNSTGIWRNPFFADTGYIPAPPSNFDVQFRKLTAYRGTHLTSGRFNKKPNFEIVGRYDPAKLPGFNPLSRVPLETYYPPLLEPADERTRTILGGKPLQPTQNIGDYIQQPPLVLTTLEALEPFLDPGAFEGPQDRRASPISAVRIRVSGVRGPDELSMARIRAVALEIRERTGLDVDITAGSSPRRLRVELPPGKFGRPRLSLYEGWVKKGVSVAFLRAVDEKTFALGGLILLAAAFFVGNGAFATVRTRRRELGTLLCVGWSPRAVFALVLLELAMIGALAGILGTGIGVGLATGFGLDVSPLRAALVLPLATALAVVAGLIPAWLAARGTPLDAVLPLLRGEARGRQVRGLPSLAVANLRRMRARTLVGVTALAAGVATLGVLLAINSAFEGSLVGTLLGEAILVRVSGLDFISVAIALLLAALALADVLYMNLRERAPELLTLKTSGWSDRQLLAAIGLEALGLGLLGALAGAMMALAAGTLIDLPFGHLLLATIAAATGGIVVALLASLAPLIHVTRLAPTTALAEE